MEEEILKTADLTKSFGGVKAVDNVEISLQGKELRCIIGPNGAGKSTLFKLFIGLLKPKKGAIFFAGEDITGKEPHEIVRRGMSIKFQVPEALENLSVRKNIRIPAQIRIGLGAGIVGSVPEEVEKTVDNVLNTVGLVEKAEEPAGNLSYGQRQWLELGAALATRPRLLLLDEPTQGMTKEEMRTTADLVKSLNRELAIIVIEHDMKFVREVAQKVTVMHNGAIFAEGTMDEIEKMKEVVEIYLGRA